MSPRRRDSWISAETEYKEADFRGLLGMHLQMCKGIGRSWSTLPYLYVDLHAGPGHLEYKGRRFAGSPLIAHDLLAKIGLPYEAMHYERDPDVAASLADALWVPVNLVDQLDAETAPIINEPFEKGFSRWLDETGRQTNRYGVVYSDPIDDPINYDLLNKAADLLPRVDLLAYVAATQYKRRRGGELRRLGHTDKPLIVEHIMAVNKATVLIRTPRGGNQYTFIIWSNWREFPEWERRGFHRVESDRGRQILDRINLTIEELDRKVKIPLWEEGIDRRYQPPQPGDKPYHCYTEYLQHARFLEIRRQVFDRASGQCERCKQRPPTEPHHLRYPPWGAFDVPENMIAVCHPCHCEIHGKAA